MPLPIASGDRSVRYSAREMLCAALRRSERPDDTSKPCPDQKSEQIEVTLKSDALFSVLFLPCGVTVKMLELVEVKADISQ